MDFRLKTKSGFLLIEVIVSLVVITSGLVLVSGSFSSAKKLFLKSDEMFTASQLLDQKIFDVLYQENKKSTPEEGVVWSISRVGEVGTDLIKARVDLRKENSRNDEGYVLSTLLWRKKDETK